MCLTRSTQVVAVEGARARVLWEGQPVMVDASLVGPLRPGDYVLVHAGVALERIDAEEAAALEQVLAEWNVDVELIPDPPAPASQGTNECRRPAAVAPDLQRREHQ